MATGKVFGSKSNYVFNREWEKSKQNIVLDLDQCLLFSQDVPLDSTWDYCQTYSKMRDSFHLLNWKSDWGRITQFRNNLRPFLDYCQLRFDRKVVWSSGGYENVHWMSEAMRGMSCIDLDLILTRDDTDFTVAQPFGNKDLKKVYSKLPGTSSENTFIVDDHESNFLQNPSNGLLIPEFQLSNPMDMADDMALPVLMEWFSQKHVVNAKDVTMLDFSDIFTTFKASSKCMLERSRMFWGL